MSYFKRVYRVLFPTLGLTFENDLRCGFDIVKDSVKEPNKLTLSLFNLSDETREKIQVADMLVELYAGYEKEDGAVKMFVGTVYQAETKNDGKDDTTILHLKDGGVAMRDSYISLSFAPGTGGDRIVKAICAEMGLSSFFGQGVQFGAFPNGYSYAGAAVDALDAICYGSGVNWSIQNNIVQFILESGISSERGVVFSPSSGLIKSPERIIRAEKKPAVENPVRRRRKKAKKVKPQYQSGWKINTLLSPGIIPGDKVKVESEIMTGWFRVEGVKHKGDTHGAQWSSEFFLIYTGE